MYRLYSFFFYPSGHRTFIQRCVNIYVYAFDIFSESRFWLTLYIEEVKLQTFVMIQYETFCHNCLGAKRFILFIGLKKRIFSFFPIVKMTANYAEIDGGRFSISPTFKFSEIFTISL